MKKIPKGSRRYWYDMWVSSSIERVQSDIALDFACIELTNGMPDSKIAQFLRDALETDAYKNYKHFMLTGEQLDETMENNKEK